MLLDGHDKGSNTDMIDIVQQTHNSKQERDCYGNTKNEGEEGGDSHVSSRNSQIVIQKIKGVKEGFH